LLAFALWLTGCSTGGDDEALVVYSSQPLSADSGGLDMLRAAQLALREADGRAGDFKVRIEALDSQNPDTAAADLDRVERNARRAADDSRTIAYLGEPESDSTAVSLPILNKAGILQVSQSSTYVGLTRAEGARPGEPGRYYPAKVRTFARLVPADHLQAAALVEYMRREGARTIAAVHDRSTYGRGLGRLAVARARNAGIAPVGPSRAVDRQPDEARDLLASDHDAVLATFAGTTPGRVVEKLLEPSRAPLVFLGDSASVQSTFHTLGNIAERARITAPLGAVPGSAAERRFIESFRDAFGYEPNPFAAYAYESMRRILWAIERVGEVGDDRRAVIREFFEGGPRRSLLGRYDIDSNGDTTSKTYGGFTIEDGELRLAEVLTAR
jgi:branched-chain amino acid transport system substrate-binding protein